MCVDMWVKVWMVVGVDVLVEVWTCEWGFGCVDGGECGCVGALVWVCRWMCGCVGVSMVYGWRCWRYWLIV